MLGHVKGTALLKWFYVLPLLQILPIGHREHHNKIRFQSLANYRVVFELVTF